jgi:ubiquinone/menaquinone biosynthesis C-methylase UbiE
MNFFSKDKKSAFEAKEAAQWIAFGPVIFQVARVLRNAGILQVIESSGDAGITNEEIAEKVKLSNYGVRVLLESGLGLGLVLVNDKKYTLGKTGHFILHDPLTITNMDFMHDVNYKGLFYLDESIETGKAAGLKEFGDWPTIYEGLSQLPPHVQKSWFSFDHFFSDDAFPKVLPMVYKEGVKKLLDIGGNTGKWAIASTKFDPDVEITIMDLPGQLNVARKRIEELGLNERVSFLPVNILDESIKFPKGFDIIWMSQFLDCFSEDQIVSILERARRALAPNGRLYIVDTYWDNQEHAAARFVLVMTTLYFACLANGNSKMYRSDDMRACVQRAGLHIERELERFTVSHTMFVCRAA